MKRYKIVKSLLLILLILQVFFTGGCSPINAPFPGDAAGDAPFSMHVIDVGQGDAVLLACDGVYMLIDAGEQNDNHVVSQYLKQMGVKQLKYAVITHPHADHCGDMADVITQFETKNIIMPNVTHTTKTWETLIDTILEKEIPVTEAQAGNTYSLGSAEFTVLAPNSNTYEALNNYSVVLKAVYQDTSFLLTGDAETLSEQEIRKSRIDISATVLKLGHHGSDTSTNTEFLQAVSPLCGVISCGANNKYGHPHADTLQKLEKQNVPAFRTDALGTIVLSSNGKRVKLTSAKNNKPQVFHTQADTALTPSVSSSASTLTYVGNKNSKIFHLTSCPSVKKMQAKNKVVFESPQFALSQGYTPCKSCNP